MTRGIVRLCALALAGLASAVGIIRAQPVDDDWRFLFAPVAGCPAVCFMGLQPGATTVAQAVALLEAHPWVAAVQQPPYPPPVEPQELRWVWRAGQSDTIVVAQPVVVTLENERVRLAAADTRLTLGDIWLHLGATELGQVSVEPGSPIMPGSPVMFLSAAVVDHATELRVNTTVSCSGDLKAFWNAEVRLILRPLVTPPPRIGHPRELLLQCRDGLR